MALVLSLRISSAQHGAGPSRPPVLGAVSLDLEGGETVALTGPSGIGKTTLLRIVAGLHHSWVGTMDRQGRVAMVFQEPTLLPWRPVIDNVTLPSGCTSEAAARLLGDVGLGGYETRYPGTLSLGQQRRLALARAFAAEPDILLLDEPFVSLDPGLADEMMDLFEALCRQRPVATIVVTHSADEARRLADRVLVLAGQPAVVTAGAKAA